MLVFIPCATVCFVEAVRESQSIGGDAGWCGRATEISNTWLCQHQGVCARVALYILEAANTLIWCVRVSVFKHVWPLLRVQETAGLEQIQSVLNSTEVGLHQLTALVDCRSLHMVGHFVVWGEGGSGSQTHRWDHSFGVRRKRECGGGLHAHGLNKTTFKLLLRYNFKYRGTGC